MTHHYQFSCSHTGVKLINCLQCDWMTVTVLLVQVVGGAPVTGVPNSCLKIFVYHLELLAQGADGSLLTGHQFLQVLVPQLLPRSALSRALTASLQFGLQVDFRRFATTFSGFLHFPSNHLQQGDILSIGCCFTHRRSTHWDRLTGLTVTFTHSIRVHFGGSWLILRLRQFQLHVLAGLRERYWIKCDR